MTKQVSGQAAFPFYADDKPSIVYIATNKNNGKRYVGITRRTMAVRAAQHKVRAARGMGGKFYAAIRKHGFDAFKFKVVQRCKTYRLAMKAEAEWINREQPEYNLTKGGEGVWGLRHSPESREKMSRAAKARGAPWAKGECPAHVREKLRASGRRRKGEKCSPEIAALRREYILRGSKAQIRPVRCLTDGMVYASVKDAAQAYGMTSGQISWYCARGRVINGRSKRGLGFVYLDKGADQGGHVANVQL